MQQYQNPNFYGQQQFMQPQFNPYLQRMENLQQFQQAIQPMATNQMPTQTYNPFGKVVESMDIVKVTDIPMDGNMYYFPQADGQAIYGKKFLPNGQTQILTFKPVLDVKPSNSTSEDVKLDLGALDEFKMAFGEWMEGVNDRLDKIECSCRQNSTQKAKKGVAENAE